MLDIEEAGCEFALGTERTRALCDTILGSPGGLTEKALAANLLAEVYMRQSEIRGAGGVVMLAGRVRDPDQPLPGKCRM